MTLIPQVQAKGDFGPVTVADKPTAFFTDFPSLISGVMNIVLIIGTVLVLFYLIWGGIDWLTSGGDKGKTESARNKITAAVIGLIIIVASWAIMTFVQRLLGISVFQ